MIQQRTGRHQEMRKYAEKSSQTVDIIDCHDIRESKAPQRLFQLSQNMAVIRNHICALTEDK